jgi:hypothetical protein
LLEWLGSNKILMGLAATGGVGTTGGVIALATVS